jgi:hypothetical protein
MVMSTSTQNHSSDGGEKLNAKIVPVMVMSTSMQKLFL